MSDIRATLALFCAGARVSAGSVGGLFGVASSGIIYQLHGSTGRRVRGSSVRY